MKTPALLVLMLVVPCLFADLRADDPIMHWDFEKTDGAYTIGKVSGCADSLEGNYLPAGGVRGKGLRLDGFTACVRRSPENVVSPKRDFTVEAWVALGGYPWNWCPVLTTESDEVTGFRLLLGPLGQAALQVAIGGEWVSCSSEAEAVPLRRWTHIVGVHEAGKEMRLYLDGRPVASVHVEERAPFPEESECLIGMVAFPEKPSDIHRTWGTIPTYFGIDGILDEIKVYKTALSAASIGHGYDSIPRQSPDISPRRLPAIDKHPGRFGAFYTKLKYYPGWDNLWPVEQDPDIVVCFERSPVKLIFWRGIRYGGSWVSENENWMTDQSVEAWEHGVADREGCFEHMQDRHCRFSHVRIIENSDARVVVHWRYAPVSAYDNTWHPDPKTGWECWIDEYYYIYPDATGIRRVSWKKGTLGHPRQFQESLALLHPEQVISDLLEKVFVRMADYENNRAEGLFVDDPNSPPYGPFSWDKTYPYTIQQYNFKSLHKPFICFEEGNKMYIRHNSLRSYDRAGGCNHFPVGQARCDGRTTRTADRPSHCSGFPISDPVINEDVDRYFWCGLYGMNDRSIDELVKIGRSWAHAPELTGLGPGFESEGFDRSRRCYRVTNTSSALGPVSFTLKGSKTSPVVNPAILIQDWPARKVRVLLNGGESADHERGVLFRLDGTDFILFLWHETEEEVHVTVIPD